LILDGRKDAEVVSVRLENIKLKNKLKKQEAQLKSQVCRCTEMCLCSLQVSHLLLVPVSESGLGGRSNRHYRSCSGHPSVPFFIIIVIV